MDVRYFYRFREALVKYCRFIKETNGKKRCVFMATPRHKNLGDHAIVRAQYEFLRDIVPGIQFYEFSLLEYETYRCIIRLITPKDVLVVIDGGGNLGTLWPNEDKAINDIITDYRDNPVMIFPQTAHYEGNNAEKLIKRYADNINFHKSVLFMVRDRKSYNLFKDKIRSDKLCLCPDIVLYTNDAVNIKRTNTESTIGLCLRDDKEGTISRDEINSILSIIKKKGLSYQYMSTIAEKNTYPAEREEVLKKKWNEFASCNLIITDRLHGMIFSAITGTPCIALDNLSKKVSGGYEWIEPLEYISFCRETDSLSDIMDSVLNDQRLNRHYYDRDKVISDKYLKCKAFLENRW